MLQDIRYGLRMLVKSPGFTIVAVLTLALGIGANTAIFGMVQNVLLRALPYQDPANLVEIWNTYPGWGRLPLSPGDYADFQKNAREFSSMAAYVDIAQGFNMTGQGNPERLQAAFATSDLCPTLGVHPVAGRGFTPQEDRAGSAPALMISHRLWQDHFGSDPGVVGRTLTLDGRGYTLAGVLPASFQLVPWADLWLPTGQYQDDLNGRIHHPFTVLARLKPGATIAEAQSDLATLNHQEELAHPDTHKSWGVVVRRMEDPAAGRLRLALLVLFAAVGLVLLIACANIVNLLLARTAARQKEIALRIALGASRSRLIRQLLTESILLSLLGGTVGIFLASSGRQLLGALAPPDLAGVKETGLNGWVLCFTTAVCFLTGAICGLIPALQTLQQNLQDTLKESGRTTAGSGGQNIRNFLVVSEIALALIPLAGAGLLIRSFHRLLQEDPGFRAEQVLTMEVNLPAIPLEVLNKMSDSEQVKLAEKQSIQFEEIAARIDGLPGVKAVGAVNVLPIGSAIRSASRFVVEGETAAPAGARPVAEIRTASLGFFTAMGIPLLQGRLFSEADYGGSNIVINEAMARRFWPEGQAVGKRVNLCSLNPKPCWSVVVGVTGNVHQYGLESAPTFDIYSTGGWADYFVIRTGANPAALAHAAVEEVHKSDPNLPVTHITTLDGLLSRSVSPRRFSAVLLGMFAGLALLLAAIGIYGVMNYVVSLRTKEIGIRMALGAQPGDIRGVVLGRGTRLAAAGIALGLAGSLALSRLLSGLLYGVQATDPLTFAAMALLLGAVALVACYLPARRAARVDPIIALRYE